MKNKKKAGDGPGGDGTIKTEQGGDTNDMDELLSNDQKDDEKVETLIPLREQLRKALSSKQALGLKGSGKEKPGCTLGSLLDIINFILNILLASLYIASTYKPNELAKPGLHDGHWYSILLLLSHIFFLLEFLMRIYAAEDFRKAIFTMENIVNMISIFPFLIITYTINDPQSRWRFFVRMLDLLRILVLLRITQYIENELSRELVKILIGAMALIVCFTGYIHWLEHMKCMFTQEQCLADDPVAGYVNFFDAFFIMMTTIAVIGYISPVTSEAGKVSMIVLMVIVVVVIPNQSSKLVSLISSKSIYARRRYKSIDKVPHIVILGSVSQIALFNFLEEYLHEDHGDFNRHCVLMQPCRPDPNIELNLMQPQYSSCVFYLEGNPLDPQDLKRCQIENAKAVIIFSDKLSFDAHKEDTHTILQAMVIKNYSTAANQQNSSSNDDQNEKSSQYTSTTQVCMQLLKPESITHYELSLSKEQIKNDQIICIESLKLSLLAKSCLCPGLVTLITNLIKSSSEPPDELKDMVEGEGEEGGHENWRWLYDYWSGKEYELYRIEIPQSFANQKFNQIAKQVYKETGFVLFALEIVVGDNINGEILLNPGQIKLPKPGNQNGNLLKYTYFGYIIAPDRDEAENIFSQNSKISTESRLNHRRNRNKEGENGDALQLTYDPLANTPAGLGKIGADHHERETNSNAVLIEIPENLSANPKSMAQRQVQKSDIEFKTLKDSKLAENHIIICGMVENIKHFVMPLRAEYLLDPSPIVILHDQELTGKQWQQLSYFNQIYYVRGSPLNEASYDRVNIMKAKQVVILTPSAATKIGGAPGQSGESQGGNGGNQDNEGGQPSEGAEGSEAKFGKDEEILLDAQTIFKYNIIKKKNPQVNVVTELISEKNLAFMLDDPLLYNIMKDYDYDQTPTFASGEVYLSSLMDSLICQAYYNPALITVLSKLIVGDTRKDSKSSQNQQPMQNLLGDTNIRQDGDFSYIRTSNLYHYSVPKEFYGMRYKTLFKHLVIKRFMIPLGIYRTEKVSFASLDPASNEEEEDENQNNNQINEAKNSEDGGGEAPETGRNQDDDAGAEDFKSMVEQLKKKKQKGDKTKEGEKDNEKYMKEIKYVITNPDKDLKLMENDTVFVLAQNDPKDPNVYWEDQQRKSTFFNFNTFDKQQPGQKISSALVKPKKVGLPPRGGGRLAVIQEEEEQSEIKINEQLQVYKHTKIEFDKRMQKIVSRIKNLREEVVQLNKLVNKRNGSIVKEIADHIDNMINETVGDQEELKNNISL